MEAPILISVLKSAIVVPMAFKIQIVYKFQNVY